MLSCASCDHRRCRLWIETFYRGRFKERVRRVCTSFTNIRGQGTHVSLLCSNRVEEEPFWKTENSCKGNCYSRCRSDGRRYCFCEHSEKILCPYERYELRCSGSRKETSLERF